MYKVRSELEITEDNTMWQIKSVVSRAPKFAMRGLLLAVTTTLLACLVLVPTIKADVSISINPPACFYGYYNYSPFACAPYGYYGPGYFYNGIFLGVGPWDSWGYNHGWGSHRFSGGGGGRYVGSRGNTRGRGPAVERASRSSRPHAAAARGGVSHGGSHATAARGGGSHGGNGGSHGGGERR
ncbi:MAG: hypothetical protein ABSD88_14010 [Candidatus Korobacteraceae bacterium]|jgi:hypothetical protein